MCAARLADASSGASVELGRLEREHVIRYMGYGLFISYRLELIYLHYTTRKPVGILITMLICIRMDHGSSYRS